MDLGIAWSFLPASARPAFLQADGPVEPDPWRRASYRALHDSVLLWRHDLGIGDAHLVQTARDALRLGLSTGPA